MKIDNLYNYTVLLSLITYSGYSGIDPNFLPWMVVWMCKGKEEEKRRKMHQFLSVVDRVFAHKVSIVLSL